MKLGLVREFFALQVAEVDEALAAYLKERTEPSGHYEMIRYHFGFSEDGKRLTSGKRMRPIFCLLIGKATGAPPAALRMLTVATELMHGASLVHDDLEDGDPMRWDRPTVWSRYGKSHAVNAGDAMIGMTYELLLRLGDHGANPATILRVLEIFNLTHLRMSEGQHLDLHHERRLDTTVSRYLEIIERKTAAACECPSRASAVVAGQDPEREEAFARFGRSFGMLYQVVDDVSGVWADSEATGKVALNDVCLRKASLPILYGFERGSAQLRTLLGGAEVDPNAPISLDDAVAIREDLTRLGVRELCQAHIRTFRDEALESLRATRCESPEISMLEMMTNLSAGMAGVS